MLVGVEAAEINSGSGRRTAGNSLIKKSRNSEKKPRIRSLILPNNGDIS